MTPVVLIVEDESSLVEVLRYNLECAGFEVVDTGSGEEALLIVEERRVDLMVLDWMLPHLSGIEVCRRLRRQPGTRNLPIIMLTARSERIDRKVSRGGRPIHLGPTEFRLLRHFMENPGRVFSRDQLIDSVWGHGIFIDSRTVDVHIRRLRKALNATDERDVIRTVRSRATPLTQPPRSRHRRRRLHFEARRAG